MRKFKNAMAFMLIAVLCLQFGFGNVAGIRVFAETEEAQTSADATSSGEADASGEAEFDEELAQWTEDGWEYIVNEDGTLTVGGYSNPVEGQSTYKLEIPSTLTVPDASGSATPVEKPVTVVGFGESGDFWPSTITEVKIPEGIQKINAWAFSSYGDLETVTILDGVTSIGRRCFVSCDKLKQIALPSTLKTIGEGSFLWCNSLEAISIPEGVTRIEDQLFHGCESLVDVTLFEGLESIGAWAFADCEKLETINIPQGVKSIGELAFYNCEMLPGMCLPDGLETIAVGVFNGCTRLSNINIPETVREIKDEAFYGCSSLTELYLPCNLTELRNGTFENCTNLEKIHIPDGIQLLEYEGESIFTNSTKVTIYTTKGSLAEQYALKYNIPVAYESCLHKNAEIRGVTPATCTEAGYSGDTYCLDCGEKISTGQIIPAKGHQWDAGVVTKEATALADGEKTCTCTVCKATKTEVVKATGLETTQENSDTAVPEVGEKVTDTASKSVYKVTAVKNGSGTVEYVKPSKTSATKVSIPPTVTINGTTYKVTKVAPKAFKNCKKLKTVTIGKNVTEIGKQAFNNCSKLSSITIKTTKLTSKNVGSKAFKGISSKAVIKVPKSKLAAYKKLLKSKGVGNKVTIKK